MNKHEPAYPTRESISGGRYHKPTFGLTKREKFILEMAKANRIAHPSISSDLIAEQALEDANALIVIVMLSQLPKESA